uniref:Uncharacterized protein n=1 Tax=Acrobeloides nanus TaxID=290746 RepID=A0A914D915_9BILA
MARKTYELDKRAEGKNRFMRCFIPLIVGIAIGAVLTVLFLYFTGFQVNKKSEINLEALRLIQKRIKGVSAEMDDTANYTHVLDDFHNISILLEQCHQLARESKKSLTYKVYTKPDLEAAIDKSIIDRMDNKSIIDRMDNETTAVVVDLLFEALKKFTTSDLKVRKRYDICKYVAKSLDMKYGRDWSCVFGDFETFIDRAEDGEYIFFQLDNYDGVEIFRTKRPMVTVQVHYHSTTETYN